MSHSDFWVVFKPDLKCIPDTKFRCMLDNFPFIKTEVIEIHAPTDQLTSIEINK